MRKVHVISIYIFLLLLSSSYFPVYGASNDNLNVEIQENETSGFVNSIQKPSLPKVQSEEPLVFKLVILNLLESGVFDEWRDVIIEENADVVLLGETAAWESVENEDFVKDFNFINSALETQGFEPYTYYNLSAEPTTTTGGAVIYSRFPIRETYQINSYALDDGTDHVFNHDLFHTVVDIGGEDIHMIGGVHWACCDYPERNERRNLDTEAALNYIDAQGPVPFIFAGDFNFATEADINADFPWISTNLGTAASDIILDADNPKTSVNHKWIDVFRTLNPYTPGFTYSSDFFNSRLDYIFVNEYFWDKVINSTAGDTPSADVGSDHYAVDVWINMNPELGDLRPPFRVQGLDATINDPTDITLTWTESESADASYYNILRDGQKLANSTSTMYDDNTLMDGALYKYEVSATDNSSNTGFNSVPLYYRSTYGIITTPRTPTITGEELPGQIRISWSVDDDGGSEILFYLLFRATEESYADGFFRIWETLEATEFTDDIFRTENKYYYRVLGVNMIGRGIFSEVLELQALPLSEEDRNGLPHPTLIPIVSILAIIPIVSSIRKKQKI